MLLDFADRLTLFVYYLSQFFAFFHPLILFDIENIYSACFLSCPPAHLWREHYLFSDLEKWFFGLENHTLPTMGKCTYLGHSSMSPRVLVLQGCVVAPDQGVIGFTESSYRQAKRPKVEAPLFCSVQFLYVLPLFCRKIIIRFIEKDSTIN